LGTLTFVGLGLHSERGITLAGLDRLKRADVIYVETYTNLMPGLKLSKLEALIGKKITKLNRENLEEFCEQNVLKDAKKLDVVLLVPGDPMTATTHIDLRLRAQRIGVKTEVIHGVSIISAASGISGLQVYKFGKTVTIPFPSDIYKPETPYDVIKENWVRGLHSLVLLDINAEVKRYMTIKEGLDYLLSIEDERRENVVTLKKLAVGVARVGSSKPTVRADSVQRILELNFGKPPHTLIFPGKLHFMEAEALKKFAFAPQEALSDYL
jgi:diphthine synthase